MLCLRVSFGALTRREPIASAKCCWIGNQTKAPVKVWRLVCMQCKAAWPGIVKDRHFPTCYSVCRIRGSSPFVGCGFDARRTSHSVAVHRAAGTTIPHS